MYDVVEEKLDAEPDFQYIPEKCAQDPALQDGEAWRESMEQLKDGLSSGTVLAQFEVNPLSTPAGTGEGRWLGGADYGHFLTERP